MSGMRGEMFSLLRGSRTEVSTHIEEEEEVRREVTTEAKEVIEEEEEMKEVFTGEEEKGSNSSGTGEKGNFKPAGPLAGRRETGTPHPFGCFVPLRYLQTNNWFN